MNRLLGALACMAIFIAPVAAQSPDSASPPPSTGTPPNGTPPLSRDSKPMEALQPDVQVVIAPGPNGWLIAAVYPGQVSHAEREQAVARLVQLTGWSAPKPRYEDRRLDRSAMESTDPKMQKAAKEAGPAPVMSSVTFETTGSLVDYQGGTLTVEPFIRAFRDKSRLHVTYLVPGEFTYRGLRHFADNNLELNVSGEQGAITFVANIRNHGLDVLNLPRYEPEAPVVSQAPATPSKAPFPLGWLSLVVIAALGAAAIAYAVAHRVVNR